MKVKQEFCEDFNLFFEKVLKDVALSGLPLSLHNTNVSIMETRNKDAKQSNYIYSGGKTGETGKIDYQKNEYSPNNSVTRGPLLKTERRKAAVTRQTLKSTNRNLRIYQNI